MRISRPLLALGVAAAVAATTSAPAASAAVGLPKPRSTVIKPNVGVGALRLDHRVRPWPKGWRRPLTCAVVAGLDGCVWATRKDALPPQGEMGIRGPFVIAAADRKLKGLVISSGGTDVDATPLRKWKTRKGIGFTSTVDEFLAAYPNATQNAVTGSYRLERGDRVTVFVFRSGILNTIEMIRCDPGESC